MGTSKPYTADSEPGIKCEPGQRERLKILPEPRSESLRQVRKPEADRYNGGVLAEGTYP
jgi:hypothetical protein